MPKSTFGLLLLTLALGLTMAKDAKAQFAVIDVGAIVQLVQQVQTLKQQLETAQNQLTQAQQQFQSMTGGRGMENLLSGANRNYLPSDWAQLAALVTNAGGAYGALSAAIQSLITANAILTPDQVARLSPAEQNQLQAARRNAALLQASSTQAMTATSARFSSLQQFVDAIPRAIDQKGALDLQARIQAEQGMLQNENAKLNLLYQSAQAEEWNRKQRAREQAMADVGSFRDLPTLHIP